MGYGTAIASYVFCGLLLALTPINWASLVLVAGCSVIAAINLYKSYKLGAVDQKTMTLKAELETKQKELQKDISELDQLIMMVKAYSDHP
jgi:hypothetical protein